MKKIVLKIIVKKSPGKWIWNFFQDWNFAPFWCPDNQILLRFGAPDNQILLHFDVPNNQSLLQFCVPDNCSSGPHLAGRIGCAASVVSWRGNEQDRRLSGYSNR